MIELLVSVGLGSIVLLTVLTIHQRMFKSQVTAINNMGITELRYEVSGLISKADHCSNVLRGVSSNEGAAITLPGNIAAGKIFGKIQIATVRLTKIQDLGGTQRRAQLEIQGRLIGANQKENSKIVETFSLYYSVTDTNSIVSCRDSGPVCSDMGGTWIVDHCDFCESLGGTLKSDGSCAKTPST